MTLEVPELHANAGCSTHTKMPWHQYALELLTSVPVPADGKLIDVGCGSGGTLLKARDMGWNGYGLDVQLKNVEKVQKLGFHAEPADLNGNFPEVSNRFDCAVSIEVVEHLVRAEHAFSEMHRILKPNGMLLLTTPNNASFKRRIRALRGKAPDDEGYHFRFWIKMELEKKLKTAGFTVIKRNSYGFKPWRDALRRMRTKERRGYPIKAKNESWCADRFVWLLQNGA